MTAITTLDKWQDEYFTMVKRVEEPVVKFTGQVAERVARFVPERPSFLSGMPKVTEVVDQQLKFRRRMVDEQGRLVHRMMTAMRPVITRVETVHVPVEHHHEAKHATMSSGTRPVTKRRATRTAA